MEKVHELRLFALLLDLVGRHGRRGAAEVLGVSYHAVARASSSGRMTGRVSDALARHLLEGGGAAASRRAERFADLLVRDARRLIFQLSEVSVPRRLFEGVLDRIGRLSPAPS